MLDNATSADEKEFYTIETQDKNVFYLVIDKQRSGENVYFLNKITESDLAALAEKETSDVEPVPTPEPACSCSDKCAIGDVNTHCEVCVLSVRECSGKAPETAPSASPEPEPEEKTESGDTGMFLIIGLAAVLVGGAGYYFKIYKPKHQPDEEECEDETEEESEETVNEDETASPPRYLPDSNQEEQDEPDEPDEPRNYDDEGDY